MSLVMAVICTDGIVVSGDFRRTKVKIDPKTKEKHIIEFYDDTHKLTRTKRNHIIGHSGNIILDNGENIEDVIQNVLILTETLNMSLFDEFKYLVGCVGTTDAALIEVGIENGKSYVLAWEQGDAEPSFNHTGGFIGDTDALKKYISIFEEKQKNITIAEATELLQKYNQLVSDETSTISPNCEIMTIKQLHSPSTIN